MKSGSNLERVIASGKPAVTAELGPPMSADAKEVVEKAHKLKGFCDAANVTDCQTAVVRISSIAAAFIAQREGLEPVMQMTCRDRNRIAMQADFLGAAALGLKNCLCIAGDHQKFSSAGRLKGHPGAKNVYDVDTCQLVGIMKKMRDEGLQEGGDKLEVAPKFFIGASWTPMGDPIDFRPYNLKKKVDAGADFIQTQGIFDVETGAFLRQSTHQGLRADSTWARGLAWSLYGFGTVFTYTGDSADLDVACRNADCFLARCPDGLVPPWDFDVPAGPERIDDSSAAAIAASGLWELAGLIAPSDPARARRYRNATLTILDSLCSDRYLAWSTPGWEGVLKHGVYHFHKKLGVDESVMWGDFFFLEAIDKVLHSSGRSRQSVGDI